MLTAGRSDEIIDGDFHFRESLPKPNGSVARLSLKITGSSPRSRHVAPLLSNLSRHFDYVLVEADTENISLAPLLEFVIQADASYLFLHPSENDLHDFDSFLGNLRSRGTRQLLGHQSGHLPRARRTFR